MGPRAVLDAVVKRKIPSPSRELNTRIPIVQDHSLETVGTFLPGIDYHLRDIISRSTN